MDKYWITLFPETFLWIKNEQGFMFNAKEFSKFYFTFDVCNRIREICLELLIAENLYTTSLTNIDLERFEVREWINNIIETRVGYITSGLEEKPISFKPILKFFKNVEYYTWEHYNETGGSIIQNLHELTFYLNNSNWGNDNYYKQTLYPLQNSTTLELKKIELFIQNSKNLFLSNINFVGNIFSYPNYKQLINNGIQTTVYITIQDFRNHIQQIKNMLWPSNICFNILIDPKHGLSLIDLHDLQVPVAVAALVSSEDEYNMILSMFEGLPIYEEGKTIPIYKGENIGFFSSNIYTDQTELDALTLTKREIFMRQALNTHHFGRLTIFPDGKVYANVNNAHIGTIDNSPYSLVYKEFTEGKSWFHIRDQKPCVDCIYQWLCPSPSNYETVIGRPNLCHVKL